MTEDELERLHDSKRKEFIERVLAKRRAAAVEMKGEKEPPKVEAVTEGLVKSRHGRDRQSRRGLSSRGWARQSGNGSSGTVTDRQGSKGGAGGGVASPVSQGSSSRDTAAPDDRELLARVRRALAK